MNNLDREVYAPHVVQKPRAVVLETPGANDHENLQYGLQKAGAETEIVHITQFLNGKVSLDDLEMLCLAGGFSYGDDFGAGKRLALLMEMERKFSDQLYEFVQKGKGVLGICNGFQTMVELGFPFGFPQSRTQKVATLAPNTSGRFESRWVRLKPHNMMHLSNGETLMLPVAHGEGKFVTADEYMIDQIKQGKLGALQYCDIDGEPTDEYPLNPNGSIHQIAGLSTGLVNGYMPHPERFLEVANYANHRREQITEPHGLLILQNVVNYFK